MSTDQNEFSEEQLGATTAYLLSEVKKRNIPYKRFHDSSLITLGYGSRQKKLRTAVVDSTSGIGIEMAGDKEETKQILAHHRLPTPSGFLVYDENELRQAFSKMKLPIVTKPLDGNHGRGVTTHIDTFEKALFGYNIAKKISDAVIVEEFLEGDDHRFLVIDFKLVAVSKRTPAMVTGNGVSTIAELVAQENKHPDRGHQSIHVLAPIDIDAITLKILGELNLRLDSVIPEGKTLYLKDTANISAGGTSTDLTDEVHPDNIFIAERVARIFNLNICGIDIITKDVSKSLINGQGGIIEVNAGPGLRMHSNPTTGKARNVAAPIMDMLFPDHISRIPVIAVVKSHDDDYTVKLLAQIMQQHGKCVGYTTSSAAFINNNKIAEIDYTNIADGELILFDPMVDVAVLTCSRGSLAETRLPFDICDIMLGLEISLDEMSALTEKIKPEGYIILDADDNRVFSMIHELPCKYAFIGTDKQNAHIINHIEAGGLAVISEQGQLNIYQNNRENTVTMDSKNKHDNTQLIKSVMATVVSSIILNMDILKYQTKDLL